MSRIVDFIVNSVTLTLCGVRTPLQDHTSTQVFGVLPKLLLLFGVVSLLNGSCTQLVGGPLARVITASGLILVIGLTMLFGFKWRRLAFVVFFPVGLFLLWGVDRGGYYTIHDRFNPWVMPGYVFDSTGLLEIILGLAGVLLYVYGLIRLAMAGSRARVAHSPDGPGTLGAVTSLALMIFATFLFGWGWTASSSVFQLLMRKDFQGLLVCGLSLTIAAVFAWLSLGVWWRHRWLQVLRAVSCITGVSLMIHGLYYLAITGTTVLALVIGRFVFGILILLISAKLLREARDNAS